VKFTEELQGRVLPAERLHPSSKGTACYATESSSSSTGHSPRRRN
jgi:hypothetical protein